MLLHKGLRIHADVGGAAVACLKVANVPFGRPVRKATTAAGSAEGWPRSGDVGGQAEVGERVSKGRPADESKAGGIGVGFHWSFCLKLPFPKVKRTLSLPRARASAQRQFSKNLWFGCVRGRVATCYSRCRGSVHGNGFVVACAVKLYGTCWIAKRVMGDGGKRAFGRNDDGQNRVQSLGCDVFINVHPGQRLYDLHTPKRRRQRAGRFTGPPFLPEWVDVGRARPCANGRTPRRGR